MEVQCATVTEGNDYLSIYVSAGPVVSGAPAWSLVAAHLPCVPVATGGPPIQVFTALAKVTA